jgi:hypothetical protein
MTGQILQNRQITDVETELDLTGLPAGIYFVEMRTNKGIGVKRLVVE